MNSLVRLILPAIALALFAGATPRPLKSAARVRYTVTDVGRLGGATSEAFGINANGLVVGRAETARGTLHAFLYYPTGATLRATGAYVPIRTGAAMLLDLTPTITGNSEARAINSLGMVAGLAYTPKGQRAHVWNTRSSELPPEANGAYSINDHGQVGGINCLLTLDRYKAAKRDAFGGESQSYVYGISEAGDAVGAELFDYAHGTTRPFLRRGAQMTTLVQPHSKGDSAAAYAINGKGEIVGTDGRNAFLWTAGRATYLDSIARSSVAYAINERGQIVGQADVSLRDQSLRAVMRENGKRTDLNACIAPDSGWTLEEARGINLSGQICGTGKIGGQRHAFLLTPRSKQP